MFAVIFEVSPHPKRWDEYLGNAALLRPELLKIEGFISNERYTSLGRPGWLVSLSIWHDEKSLIRWRTHALHHEIQGKGRESILADYHLRVGEITTDTQPGRDTPLSRQRFDTTEAGLAKAVSLTEAPVQTMGSPAVIQPGLLASDSFDSITRPGNGLSVKSWQDEAAAEDGIAAPPGRHRIVRVIRDYGMFARTEAPQYFPPPGSGGRGAGGDRSL